MQNNGCKELAYFSNKYFSSKQTFITNYLLRWSSEHGLKAQKDAFLSDYYQIAHSDKLERNRRRLILTK